MRKDIRQLRAGRHGKEMGPGVGQAEIAWWFPERTGTPSRVTLALACYRDQEISSRMGGGRVLAGRTGTSQPTPLPSAHGKWSLCLVSGSGLLSCQDPGFPAAARSFPFDF